MTFDEWKATRQKVDDLPQKLSNSEVTEVTDEGLIYYDETNQISGFIEIIGPDFYILNFSNMSIAEHGDDGLAALEQILYDHVKTEIS